ncbi:YfcC family protein [Bengtsoniella intestinalis]|uniref:YfcC family protein n=1 Tax=Bengtsoniella intestinalis TaxID=3073143 RepID=UPI00391FABEF
MQKPAFSMPTAYTILFALLVLVALSTWVIPSGAYTYEDGVPISGSYHSVEPQPQGIGDVLKAPFAGFGDAVDICVFILMVGGFLGVVMHTGAIDAGVATLIAKLGDKQRFLIPILMIFFGLGGTCYGMWEETMAFYPLLIPVFIATGYDALVGIGVILLGAGAGVIGSTVNPFATGIGSGFAGVSLGDGLMLRLAIFVVLEAIAIWYVMSYANKVYKNPVASLCKSMAPVAKTTDTPPPLTHKQTFVLALFGLTFATMVYGVIPFEDLGVPLPTLHWWFPDLAALYLVMGTVVGLVSGLKEEQLTKTFVDGSCEMLGVAFIIGISRGITVLMRDGNITDTVLHWGEEALSGASSITFVLLVFAIYLPLSVLIPSSSGLATLSIPILAPIGAFSGVGGALIVTAFQSASGLVNLITPTAAVVMGALAFGKVPYDKWVQFVWKLVLGYAVLIVGFLAVGTMI